MPRLFSYCIPVDDGAAPNPYWDVCTLVICKPVIRRTAEVGDWIVGTGSTRFGFANKVVYAMEVTEKMTMKDYDAYCRSQLPGKIPDARNPDYTRRVGDCIYDFSTNPATIRKSVHNEGNRMTDTNGKYALLSDHFYYFGKNPLDLEPQLVDIVKQGQGHRSTSNDPYFHEFVEWILKQTHAKNTMTGEPYLKLDFDINGNCRTDCASVRRKDAEQDELLDDVPSGLC